MKIVVFDTETISIEKPFCYNIGYMIVDMDSNTVLTRKDFVVEQVWHNPMLFNTAYYADKRDIYVKAMRCRKTTMDKFGYICQTMIRDFKAYEVELAFAYNSGFDERVFQFNCEWFKCNNPFDEIPIRDIRGFVHTFIALTKDFQDFCETNAYFTESLNYSTTAETLFRYISKDNEFNEEHTALADSEIEFKILQECLSLGADLNIDYPTKKSIERKVQKHLLVVVDGVKHDFGYISRRNSTDGSKIILKN